MHLSRALKIYAKKVKTPVQISLLDYYGKNRNKENLLAQSQFLKEELPIRLCHRVFDLVKLPYGLPIVPEIKSVIDLYSNSFDRLLEFEKPDNIETVEKFTDLLEDIKNKHTNLEESIAIGIKSLDNPLIDYSIINNELDTFFLSRIGVRTLISHQIDTVKYNRGIIQNCKINNIIKDAIDDSKFISNMTYGDEPNIIMNNTETTIDYIPGHLHYILLEILKNSVVSHFINNNFEHPINVVIGEGKNNIIIKISDNGLGFPFKQIKNVLTYSYSTTPIDNIDEYEITNKPIIAGFGFGLPMAKIHCRYLGGDLIINPIEGIGTDVFIYISKLGDQQEQF